MPFPELCGESVEYLERTSDAILALSNFRLFIRFDDSFVNVSLIIPRNYLNGTFHYDTGVGQKKNLSPRQESNP